MRRHVAKIELILGIVLLALTLLFSVFVMLDYSDVFESGVNSITQGYNNAGLAKDNPELRSSLVIEATLVRLSFFVFITMILLTIGICALLILEGLKRNF